MIPASYIQEWSSTAPWPDSRLIEQDLIITRALCDLFDSQALAGKIAFRGGTAINKLLFRQPLRYSEDIDLVQTQQEPIGATIDAIREALSWLGKCSRHQAGHSMHLVFKFAPEVDPETTLKLKVEINTREHESLYGIKRYPFELVSCWYQAKTEILSFEPEELFGTKLRALLQRRKNRDLFDLHEGLKQLSMEQCNFSNVKGVGAGVYEYRISFGPGYRIYFGKDGDRLVILLAGGTKKRQDTDIKAAQAHWRDYKRRTRKEV